MKRTALALFALVGFSLPLVAQNTETFSRDDLEVTGQIDTVPALAFYRSDLFSDVDGSALIHGLPVLTLLDGRRFPINSELGRMGMSPLDMFPVAFLNAVTVQKHNASPMYGTDAPGGLIDLRLNRNYSGGEFGVFYGKSGGRYGREDFQTYIIGSTGNDKFQITAGAAYQESTIRVPTRSVGVAR